MLKLMYITNDPKIAKIVENAGVDRIFVDLEFIGKSQRQANMDTVQSKHTLEDVRKLSGSIKTAELLVRINPMHNETEEYMSSEEEIDKAIENGANILMLPYFKTTEEVETFVRLVNGRVRTMLLVETPEAVRIIDDILKIDGIDEIHIGLNDLSLGYGMKFMFELLANGLVDELCEKLRNKGIPYGFGGIASLEGGAVPGKGIITEHYRLGSGCAILSRSFCDTAKITDKEEIEKIFNEGIKKIREYEGYVSVNKEYYPENRRLVREQIEAVCRERQ